MASVITMWLAGLAGAKLIIDVQTWFEMRDAILRHIYEIDRQAWVNMGRPRGKFWRPKNEERNSFGYTDAGIWRSISQLKLDAETESAVVRQRAAFYRIVRLDIPIFVIAAAAFLAIYYG